MLFGTVGEERSNERTRYYSQYIEFLAGLMYVSHRPEGPGADLPLVQHLRNNPPANIRETSMVHRCSWLHSSWSREHVADSSDGQVRALLAGEQCS